MKLMYFRLHPKKNCFYLTRNKTYKMNSHMLLFNIIYMGKSPDGYTIFTPSIFKIYV